MFEGISGMVTILVDGTAHSGSFEVTDGIVRVMHACGERAMDLGELGLHPEYIARFLLEDIVRASNSSID